MPRAHNGEVSLYYETDGEGPTVAFVNDVGYGAWLWGWQHPALAGPFETLVWDLPGTGRSDARPGSPAVADFAADLEAVLSAHGARTVHLVGAGLGGMIALQYALEYGRAGTLALCSTAASGAAVDEAALAALFASPDEPAALRASLDAAFAPGVADAHPDVIDRIAGWRADDDADRAGWEAQAGA
jgi:pimeloyl-ACP methyl ester carboxylesterase